MAQYPAQTRRAAALAVLAVCAATPAAWAEAPAPPVSPAPVVNLEYDAVGNPTRSIQAPSVPGFNFTTTQSYDRLHRRHQFIDARAGVTSMDYNGRTDLTRLTDPRNLVTQMPRNGLGDTTALASPDTGTASHTFDAAGNLKTRLDSRGVLATYSYDALNRATGVVYSRAGTSSQSFSWTYDQTGSGFSNGVGRLTSTTYPGGSDRYSYDASGRLASQVSNSISVTNYEYDAAGNIIALTYPSGRKLLVSYANGQPSAMSLAPAAGGVPVPLIAGIQWQPFGPVKAWQWQMASGARVHDRVYDIHGRLVRYPMGNLLRDLSYDAADRVIFYGHYVAATGASVPSANQSFAYDELGRLIGVATAGWNWTIGYDANGNRTSTALNGSANTYTTENASNRVTAISNPARSIAYDAAGNTTVDYGAIPNFATYDLSNRLGAVDSARKWTQQYISTYSYNASGQRVAKVVESGAVCAPYYPGGTKFCGLPASSRVETRFVYDQRGRLLGEYESGGQAIREYIWLGETPIAVSVADPAGAANPPLVYYIHTDHLDTPRHIVDRSGNIRWSWDAEPFGAPAPDEDPSGLGAFTFNLRFPGQYFDSESEAHYNYYRNYDPSTGRYTQSDPIGLAGGINTYSYVNGQPTRYSDPLGLWSPDAHNDLINGAFPGLSPNLLAKIRDGSAAVDALTNQFGDGSFTHGMRAPGQSIEDARRKACKFIRDNLALYNALKNSPASKNRLSAYYALGQALHPVMDSTSPQHRGWQVWAPHPGDVWNKQSQPWRHGDNSPEDLAHLTPELKQLTIERMLDAVKSGNCDCMN